MTMLRDYLIELLYVLPGIILALSVHEYAHALVSTKLGDPLPRATGRLTLNPFQHIDPIGFFMLIVLQFGWAKPVHVDPRYYKRKKLGMNLVALAGPASNLLTGFMLALGALLVNHWYWIQVFQGQEGFGVTALGVVCQILIAAVQINVGLAIFNLIPISPLDGSKVLASVLPLRAYNKVLEYENYGTIALLILMFDIPARVLVRLGIPGAIAQYFGLFYYMNIARGWIIGLFEEAWLPLLNWVL